MNSVTSFFAGIIIFFTSLFGSGEEIKVENKQEPTSVITDSSTVNKQEQVIVVASSSNEDVKTALVIDSKQNSDAVPRVWKVWKTYTANPAFIFKYPDISPGDFSVKQEKDSTRLYHDTLYRQSNICKDAFRSSPIDTYIDFNVTFKIVSTGLKDSVKTNNTEKSIDTFFSGESIRLSPGLVDTFNAGKLKGYQIKSGDGECGKYTYYFPVSGNRTLVVVRHFITKLDPSASNSYYTSDEFLSRGEEDDIFTKVLSSIVISTSTGKENSNSSAGETSVKSVSTSSDVLYDEALNYQKNARDAVRRAHIMQIKFSLLMFYENNQNKFPTDLNEPGLVSYLSPLPLDPVTKKLYEYTLTANGKDYLLCAVYDIDLIKRCTSEDRNDF